MFDHTQSSRLGQKTQVDNTAIRMFSGQELPESPWHGMMVYRTDTQELQIFDSEADGWVEVVGGQLGQLTYVGSDIPVAQSIGDQWFNTSTTPRQLYIAMSVGADEIAEGEWVAVSDLTAIEERLDEVEDLTTEVIQAPTTIYSETQPTTAPGRDLINGDTWVDTVNRKQFKYDNGDWVSFSFDVEDFSLTVTKFQTTSHFLY